MTGSQYRWPVSPEGYDPSAFQSAVLNAALNRDGWWQRFCDWLVGEN